MKRLMSLGVVALVVGGAVWRVTSNATPAAGDAGTFGYGVGELVSDFAFTDIEGTPGRLSDFADRAATVIVMRDVGCPVTRRYGPRIARMAQEFADRGVAFVHLNVSPQDSPEDVRAEIARFDLDGRYVRDPTGEIGALLHARTTAEVFVIDAARTLRYRGAIDDQYGITYTRPSVRHAYLRDALEQVLAGRDVAIPSTVAEGCHLGLDQRAAELPVRPVTYHNRISRIVQNNCQTCHRTGGVGPFPFERYEDVYGFRQMIRYVLDNGIMPPWFADSSVGQWANDRSLSPRDRRDLLAWIDAGAPEGDSAHAPLPRAYAPGWNIGTPDAVVQIEQVMDVPAEGVVDYQYVYIKTDFPTDRWVTAMEVRPTAPQVVHHVLVFIEPPGAKSPRRAEPGEPVFQGGIDGYFAATVPGFEANRYPERSGKLLPQGAWLKFQIHYTPNGVATTDQPMIGFQFADQRPARVVETASAYDARFEIPPGASRHEVSGEYTFGVSGELLSLFPHMHLRGAAFRYELEYPDGRVTPLLSVPRYDFNWQLYYSFAEPLVVPAGATLRATGWFDNSAENPANPDPTAVVGFGEQTFDEMMIGYFDWIPVRTTQETGAPDNP